MKNVYNEMLKFDKAELMFHKIKRNCKNKQAVYNFGLYLNENIYRILELLYKREYKFSKYRIFMIRY